MTQPAFGRRIRALEDWLGTELFDRSSHPVRLTVAGQWFQSVAQDLLEQVARVPGEARAVAEMSSRSLRFAATHALSFTFVPRWLRRFDALTLVGTVQLESDVLQRCESLLEHSKVQFVLCHAHAQVPGKLDTDGYRSLRIGRDRLIPVTAVDEQGVPLHRLEQGESPVALLSYSAESGLSQILRETCQAELNRIPTHTAFTAHLASVLRTMVLDGRGIAWLPQSLIRDDLLAGTVVPAAAPHWHVDLDIRLYRARSALGQVAEALWEAAAVEQPFLDVEAETQVQFGRRNAAA